MHSVKYSASLAKIIKNSTMLGSVGFILLACSSEADEGNTVTGGRHAPEMNPQAQSATQAAIQAKSDLSPIVPVPASAPVVAVAPPSTASSDTVTDANGVAMKIPASVDQSSGPYSPEYKEDKGFFDTGFLDRWFGPSDKAQEEQADQKAAEKAVTEARHVPMDNPSGLRSDEMAGSSVPVGSEPYPQLSSVPASPVPPTSASGAQQNMDTLASQRDRSEAMRKQLSGNPPATTTTTTTTVTSPANASDYSNSSVPSAVAGEVLGQQGAPPAAMPQTSVPAQDSNWQPAPPVPVIQHTSSLPAAQQTAQSTDDGSFGDWLSGLFSDKSEESAGTARPPMAAAPAQDITNQAVPVAAVQQQEQIVLTPPRGATFAKDPGIDTMPATVGQTPPIQTAADQAPIQLTEPVADDNSRYLTLTPPSQEQKQMRMLPESRYAARRMTTYR